MPLGSSNRPPGISSLQFRSSSLCNCLPSLVKLLLHVELESLERLEKTIKFSGWVHSSNLAIAAHLLHLIKVTRRNLYNIPSEIILQILNGLPRVFVADEVDRDSLSTESSRST